MSSPFYRCYKPFLSRWWHPSSPLDLAKTNSAGSARVAMPEIEEPWDFPIIPIGPNSCRWSAILKTLVDSNLTLVNSPFSPMKSQIFAHEIRCFGVVVTQDALWWWHDPLVERCRGSAKSRPELWRSRWTVGMFEIGDWISHPFS